MPLNINNIRVSLSLLSPDSNFCGGPHVIQDWNQIVFYLIDFTNSMRKETVEAELIA